MNKYFLLFSIILITNLYSQNGNINGSGDNDVIKIDPKFSQFNFVPNQVLVKFKDDAVVHLSKTSAGKTVLGISKVDEILSKYNLQEAGKLFAGEKRKLTLPKVKTFSGKEITVPNLHNIYKLEFDSTQNILQIIDELKEDTDNIEYVEPNYIFSAVNSEALSPELNESEMIEWLKEHPGINANFNSAPKDATDAVVPNDPLYGQQWAIPAAGIDKVWALTTGDTTQVIAILDTGVDWLHPDLINNIWSNLDEIPDNGFDDDHNGYYDDVRGWDFVNKDNNPRDDNSHGTHVAGIAAAEGDNGIGITGVNWKAKIMALKVLNHKGYGDVGSVVQAINYASNKKATIINMSFGSYSRSQIIEDVLVNASTSSILVAAAGNDGSSIGPGSESAPFYPAAYSFVLGIRANADYSNYDQDGPTFSLYEDLLNYELKAPGSAIISTVPEGGYRVYSGTSMSASLVSGAISLYRNLVPVEKESNEFMYVKLIDAAEDIIKINKVLDVLPEPQVYFLNHTIVDTLGIDDKDGTIDAGETIEMWFSARNTGSQVDSVYWKIKLAELEDTSMCKILKPLSYFGTINPYEISTSQNDPMKFKISPNIANGRDVSLKILSWYKGSKDTSIQDFKFSAKNGSKLKGILDTLKVLTPDKLWIIDSSFKISPNGHLKMLPGTKLELFTSFVNDGLFSGEGTADSLVDITGKFTVNGNLEFRFTKFHDISGIGESYNSALFQYGNQQFSYCIFDKLYSRNIFSNDYSYIKINNSSFSNINADVFSWYGNFKIVESIFYKLNINSLIFYINGDNVILNSTFYNSINNHILKFCYYYWNGSNDIKNTNFKNIYMDFNGGNYVFSNCNFINPPNEAIISAPKGYTYQLQNLYWGTQDTAKINNLIYDFYEDPNLAEVQFVPFAAAPSDSAHGIVWKVLVNSKDAQDEYIEPIEIGVHRFDVYFNREMNKNYPPQFTFGLREPFTQRKIDLNGTWSDDGKIYTAYKKVELYTGDGINTIRVAGARDLEDFEIPVEDFRFKFLIDAAGSASSKFTATAGIGKVELKWTRPSDIETLFGYNIYRFIQSNDTIYTDPQKVNSIFVSDTIYTDYDVEPLKKYFYQYKVVKTDFTESDFSKVVNSTVLTAVKGDANGDLTVNILDITTVVNYILNQNPQPFILAAADYNNDHWINILDIVAIINKVLNPNGGAKMLAGDTPKFRFTDSGVYLKRGIGIAGIELKIALNGAAEGDLIAGDLLKGMEFSYKIENDTLKVIAYSFKNETISSEDGLLFKLLKGKIIKLVDLKAADRFGNQVEVEYSNDDIVLPKDFILYQNYPNPFNPETTIRFALPEKANVEIAIYNILGQRVKLFNKENSPAGYHEIKWNSRNDHNVQLASGVYIYQVKAGKFISQKKMILLK
ncbi:MAG: S8 family serine peptidase [Melioribacteraceae bacterium]|nr:S8 family serine peptidase [Melioribacteraceae bacterium]